MKRILLPGLALFLVVSATLPGTLRAGDGFWHGKNIGDAGMKHEDMQAIHDAILKGMTDLAPTPTGFPTGDMLNDEHRGLRIYEPAKTWGGYTLLNCFTGTGTAKNGNNILIDMEGNIVNEWTFPGVAYLSASKVLPGGHIVGSSIEDPMAGGGKLTQMDWNGVVVRQWSTTMHHDHEREGSPSGYYAPGQTPRTFGGKVLVLESSNPPFEETGHVCSSKRIVDDTIRELGWNGEELFRWETWKHFDQLGLDEWAGAGIDLGRNYQGPDFMAPILPEDWSHGNAVAWVGENKWWDRDRDARFHPENIIADFRSLNITIIIARHRHPKGKWEKGDIVWKLGPDYSTSGEDYKVGQIIGQHMAHMIPKHLPGAGNMLIFDNGGAAGYGALVRGLRAEPVSGEDVGMPLGAWPSKFRMYSRVLEIDPVTKEVVWEFKQPRLSEDRDGDGKILGNEKLFFSNLMSGAQRLPNGNTLITEADVGRVFEVTKSGEVVWEFAPTWVNSSQFMGVAIYRAYRVPYWWAPGHGRAQ